MTGPINIETIVPTRYKAIVGLVGSVLSFAVPYVVQVEQFLPSPWPVVIGSVISVLTFFGIVKAPYVPQGAVLAPNTPEVAVAAQGAVTQAAVRQAGGWVNPWTKPQQLA